MHHPPIKRHAALVPFSHDHNVGLYHAKRLRMASGMGDHLDPGTVEVRRVSESTSSEVRRISEPTSSEVRRVSESTSSSEQSEDVQREGLEEREGREGVQGAPGVKQKDGDGDGVGDGDGNGGGRMGWHSVQATREAWAAFKPIWEGEIAQHFLDEEQTLIPLIDDQSMIDRLLAEHVHLRDLVARADAAASGELTEADLPIFGELGIALTDHIRWEERELFAYVQDHTDQAGLEDLRKATEEAIAHRPASKARPR